MLQFCFYEDPLDHAECGPSIETRVKRCTVDGIGYAMTICKLRVHAGGVCYHWLVALSNGGLTVDRIEDGSADVTEW
jgi:hypothetical protein